MTDPERAVWHSNVIPASTEAALGALRDATLLDGFYLGCGTGLALQLGHRLSRDLDFFVQDHFNEDVFLQRLQKLGGFALAAKAPDTLHATIHEAKVSFLGYTYPVLFPMNSFLEVAVADPRDIACMKLSAIASRGTKRNFIDLYFCVQRYGLKAILNLFEQKYAQTNLSRIHILKSLSFFDDAERDPLPHMLVALDWDRVKQFFRKEAPQLI